MIFKHKLGRNFCKWTGLGLTSGARDRPWPEKKAQEIVNFGMDNLHLGLIWHMQSPSLQKIAYGAAQHVFVKVLVVYSTGLMFKPDPVYRLVS